jgi:hypothetical protein
MKGRRKIKTDKWLTRERIIKDAREKLISRTSIIGRFLDIAAHTTIEEPIGLLAGSHRPPMQSAPQTQAKNRPD